MANYGTERHGSRRPGQAAEGAEPVEGRFALLVAVPATPGTATPGTATQGTGPQGTGPQGTGPQGTGPQGTGPQGTAQSAPLPIHGGRPRPAGWRHQRHQESR